MLVINVLFLIHVRGLASNRIWTHERTIVDGSCGSTCKFHSFKIATTADFTKQMIGYWDNSGSGAIWRSTDSGSTWTIVVGGGILTGMFTGVAMSSDGTKVAAVTRGTGVGTIWDSTDGGATWSRFQGSSRFWLAHTTSSDWRGIAMSADGTKRTAVFDNGNIWSSTDSGVTWTENTSSPGVPHPTAKNPTQTTTPNPALPSRLDEKLERHRDECRWNPALCRSGWRLAVDINELGLNLGRG